MREGGGEKVVLKYRLMQGRMRLSRIEKNRGEEISKINPFSTLKTKKTKINIIIEQSSKIMPKFN